MLIETLPGAGVVVRAEAKRETAPQRLTQEHQLDHGGRRRLASLQSRDGRLRDGRPLGQLRLAPTSLVAAAPQLRTELPQHLCEAGCLGSQVRHRPILGGNASLRLGWYSTAAAFASHVLVSRGRRPMDTGQVRIEVRSPAPSAQHSLGAPEVMPSGDWPRGPGPRHMPSMTGICPDLPDRGSPSPGATCVHPRDAHLRCALAPAHLRTCAPGAVPAHLALCPRTRRCARAPAPRPTGRSAPIGPQGRYAHADENPTDRDPHALRPLPLAGWGFADAHSGPIGAASSFGAATSGFAGAHGWRSRPLP